MIVKSTQPADLSNAGAPEVRRIRLQAHQRRQAWSDSELARRCKRQPQQVNAWWRDERQIGEKLARSLEAVLHLSAGYLDDVAGAVTDARFLEEIPKQNAAAAKAIGGITYAPAKPADNGSPFTAPLRSLPVLSWRQLPDMLPIENTAAMLQTGFLDSYAAASNSAKFVQMIDDSMAPQIHRGDHVLLDPTELPVAGDVVLVRIATGEHFLRLFRPRTAYVFHAVAANPAHEPLSSDGDGAEVVGVMVEHRAYRRRQG